MRIGLASRALAGLALVLSTVTACTTRPNPPFPPNGGFLANPPAPGETARAEAFAHYADAASAAWHNDFAAAEAAYARALAADPAAEEPLIARADSLRILRRAGEALQSVESFCASNPAATNALLWLAVQYDNNGEYPRSVELFERLLALHPATPEYLLGRALATIHLKAREQGIEDAAEIPLDLAVPPLEDALAASSPSNALIRRAILQLYVQHYSEKGPRRDPDLAARCISNIVVQAEAILQQEPADPKLADLLVSTYVRQDRFDDALRVATASLPFRSDDDELRTRIAALKARDGDEDAARELLAAQSGEPPTRIDVARFFVASDLPEHAIRIYRELLAADPSDDRAWLDLVVVLLARESPQASSTLRQALRACPDSPALLAIAAARAADAHRYTRADELCERAWANDPGDALDATFAVRAAETALHLRNPERAALWLSRGLERGGDVVSDFAALAVSSPDRIRRGATKALLSLYEASNRENLDAGIAAANLLLVTDRPRQAFPILSGIDARLRENPLLRADAFENGTFYFFLGVAADETGHPDIVLDAMERCVASGGHPATAARNYVAYTLSLLGKDLDHALEYALAVTEAEPENASYLDTLAWVHFRRGEPLLALPPIEKAARLEPENPTIAAHLRAILAAQPSGNAADGESSPAPEPAP